MLKRPLAIAAFALCFTAPAIAQNAALPAVDTMDCAALTAEMTTAGAQMSSQLDVAGMQADNEAAQEDAARRRREAAASSATSAAVCSIPGMGMACTAAMQAQAAQAQRGMPEAQARQQRQIDRVQNSMAGLDQDRLMAISTRFEEMRCPTPQ